MTLRTDIPGAEIVALGYALAVARRDDTAVEEAKRGMVQFEPGVIVGALACIVVDFARLLSIESDNWADAVDVIEDWMACVLDDNDGR